MTKSKLYFAFIGGKEIGYKCLVYLLRKKLVPKYVIPNIDDNGKDTAFHNSIVKLAKKSIKKTFKFGIFSIFIICVFIILLF